MKTIKECNDILIILKDKPFDITDASTFDINENQYRWLWCTANRHKMKGMCQD
jgi:hypothetical protein